MTMAMQINIWLYSAPNCRSAAHSRDRAAGTDADQRIAVLHQKYSVDVSNPGCLRHVQRFPICESESQPRNNCPFGTKAAFGANGLRRGIQC
jgi:hypothetical protein